MDNIITAALLSVLAILIIVDAVCEVVDYYHRQKLLRELVEAALRGDDDPDLEDEVAEVLSRECEEDEEDACLSCKHREECEPLDKAHAFEDGCVRWEETKNV